MGLNSHRAAAVQPTIEPSRRASPRCSASLARVYTIATQLAPMQYIAERALLQTSWTVEPSRSLSHLGESFPALALDGASWIPCFTHIFPHHTAAAASCCHASLLFSVFYYIVFFFLLPKKCWITHMVHQLYNCTQFVSFFAAMLLNTNSSLLFPISLFCFSYFSFLKLSYCVQWMYR